MTTDQILADWRMKRFKPVYWLEGDEEYYIDKVVNYAEHHILSDAEASFNLTVFYGRDTTWMEIINACRRYPMNAEKQVVLLKEAQHLKDVDKLEGYVGKPLGSTVFIVAYKDKKVDGRTKLARLLKENGVVVTTKKIYEDKLPAWTQDLVRSKDLSISPKGLVLLVDHIGNDLSRIENEVNKILLNLGKRKTITEDDIEEYVGVSKDYNVFELQAALSRKDLAKCISIIQYFESNPKAGPIQLVLPALYSHFSKVFMVFGCRQRNEKEVVASLGVNAFFAGDYIRAANAFGYEGIEKTLLLLHQYNLRSVGINSGSAEDSSLLKEMVCKILS